MSDHDVLMSKLMELRAILTDYVVEYEPVEGDKVLQLLDRVMVKVNNFPQEAGNG